MYKSPIELIYESIQSQLDECIYKEIQKADIKVDKDELLKALAYDREQYKKGYEDGKAERENGKWIEKQVGNAEDWGIDMLQSARCSACGFYHTTPYMYCFAKYNYCPHCGAKMDEEEKNDDERKFE